MTRRHAALSPPCLVVVAVASIPLALTLAPALLLLAVLASGRHPGERMIERMRARRQARARRIVDA